MRASVGAKTRSATRSEETSLEDIVLKRSILCAIVATTLCFGFLLCGCSSSEFNPEKKSATITTPTISQSGTLRVGVNTDNAPLAGETGSSGKIVGIDVDIAAALADELGLKVEVVNVGSDAIGALKNGKVDIVLGVDTSNADTEMWKSVSYLETAVSLFSAKSGVSIPETGSGVKIGAQISSMSSWAVTNEYGADALVSQDDLSSAFNALKEGTVEFVAADAVIGSYAAHTIVPEATIIALMQKKTGYSIAALNSNTDLTKVITETLAELNKNGMIDLIKSKWLGSEMNLSKVEYTPLAKKAVSEATATDTNAAA